MSIYTINVGPVGGPHRRYVIYNQSKVGQGTVSALCPYYTINLGPVRGPYGRYV